MSIARNNPPNQENVPDADWDVLWGDFLELDDLPSSSSGNSSCLTMSSNENFDLLGLSQDIENEDSKKGADHKFNVAAVKPDRIVTCALSPDIPAGRALPKQEIIEERQNPGSNPPVCSRAMSASPSEAGKSAVEAARWKKAPGGG